MTHATQTFQELSNLLPGKEIDIVMVGDELAPSLHDKVLRHTNRHNGTVMYFRVFVGLYQNYRASDTDTPPPDLVMGKLLAVHGVHTVMHRMYVCVHVYDCV